MTPPRISVSLFQPLPNSGQLFTTDLNPSIATLSWSTAKPGGFLGLTVTLNRSYRIAHNPKPQAGHEIQFRYFSHVRVRVGLAVLWEGRIEEFDFDNGGDVSGFTAVGYGTATVMKDNWYDAGAAGTGTGTAAGLLRDVLRVCSRIVRPDENKWADSAIVTTTALADKRFPQEVIGQLSQMGSDINPVVWDFCVWEDQLATWLPRIPPAQATYQLTWDDTIQKKTNASNVYSSVAVQYTPTQFGAPSTLAAKPLIDPLLQYGIVRSTILKAGTMTAAQAAAYLETQRLLLSQPETAITITRDDNRGLEMPGGSMKAAWLVRADEWVTISGEGPYPIIHTDYTRASGGTPGQVTIQCGFYPKDYEQMTYDLQRYAQNQNYRTMPLSGAPW